MEFDHRFFLAHDYALINPMQVDAEIVQLWKSTAIVPDPLKSQQKLMPRLIMLRGMNQEEILRHLDLTMHYGQARRKQPFCGLLQSSGTSNRVVRHLAKVMIQRIGDEQMWLRVHDPRVWANLEWILQPGQFDSLLGPIQQWAWPSPLTDEWSAKVSVANTNRRLDLDIEQMRALSMVGSINNVIAKLKREALAAHGNTGLHKVAYHELLRAQKIGLNSDEDAEFFAFLSLARTPLIHEEPSAKRMIDMAIQGTCGYMSAWIDENGQAMEENVEEVESYGAD